MRRLSGGNQQKVTIARWIARGVETLLLFDPTRGIDIRTKRQIYALVRDLADQGAAVLFYTSELAEVRLACDRAVVIFNGRVVDVIDGSRCRRSHPDARRLRPDAKPRDGPRMSAWFSSRNGWTVGLRPAGRCCWWRPS